ncbi:hypothetical protein D2M30_3387 [Bacillus amyloliquefaciens]|nr:hypothetical protein D2M30_3387 [Bacillus amyloliquefaciens]
MTFIIEGAPYEFIIISSKKSIIFQTLRPTSRIFRSKPKEPFFKKDRILDLFFG